MKTIRLAVFNEDYWNTGLIYTQNILPLMRLAKAYNAKFQIYSFLSVSDYVRNRTKIKDFRKKMANEGVDVKNMMIFYFHTRYLLPHWFILPYLFLNTFFHVFLLNFKDRGKDIVYDLRSYQTSLVFYLFYKKHDRLIFDTRTDFIEENVNSKNFSSNGLTVKIWNNIEKKIIESFKYSLFISDVFRQNIINKHNIQCLDKLLVVYNPIDYKHFENQKEAHDGSVFLYTGSLGGWNLLENYLEVFKAYHDIDNNSRFIVCTRSSQFKVNYALNDPRFASLKDSVEIHYNVTYDELPNYYSKCDYGFQIMSKVDSRVGVKFVEYVAANLVPIVNENVQGAAYLSKKYNIGMVLSANDSSREIYDKICKCREINVTSEEYQAFRNLTDIDMLVDNSIYKSIYFN